MEPFILLLFAAILGIFALSSAELGVDSRDASDDPHRPSYPVGLR